MAKHTVIEIRLGLKGWGRKPPLNTPLYSAHVSPNPADSTVVEWLRSPQSRISTEKYEEHRYLCSELGCRLLNCTWLVYFRLVETAESTKNAKSSLIALVFISFIEQANSMFQPLSAPSPHERHATCTLMTTRTDTDRRICRKTRTRTNRRVETRHVRQTSLRRSQNTVGIT